MEKQESKKADVWAPAPARIHQLRFDVSPWVGDKMAYLAAERQVHLQTLTRLFIHEVLSEAGLISTPFPAERLVPDPSFAKPALVRNIVGEHIGPTHLICWVEAHERKAIRQICGGIGQDKVLGLPYAARGLISLRLDQLGEGQGQQRSDRSLKLVRDYLNSLHNTVKEE